MATLQSLNPAELFVVFEPYIQPYLPSPSNQETQKNLTGAETWGLWTKDPGPRGVPGLVMYEHGVMFIGPRGGLETPQASSCFAMMNGNSLKFAEAGNSSSISDIAFFF